MCNLSMYLVTKHVKIFELLKMFSLYSMFTFGFNIGYDVFSICVAQEMPAYNLNFLNSLEYKYDDHRLLPIISSIYAF